MRPPAGMAVAFVTAILLAARTSQTNPAARQPILKGRVQPARRRVGLWFSLVRLIESSRGRVSWLRALIRRPATSGLH